MLTLPSPLTGFFERLGRTVEDSWSAVDFERAEFAPLATSCLNELRARLPDYTDILTWLALAGRLGPPAKPGLQPRRGEGGITLFAGERFCVDLLFWVDGAMSIHRPIYDGALQIIAGEALYSQYEFTARDVVCAGVELGELEVVQSDHLVIGDCRPVDSRQGCHSFFHLGHPACTLVVHTYEDLAQPQRVYRPPGIAFDPILRNPLLAGKVRLLSAMNELEHRLSLAAGLIDWVSLPSAVVLLDSCLRDSSFGASELGRLMERLDRRDARLAKAFRRAVRERLRERVIVRLRRVVASRELRFFLGALRNSSSRRDVLDLVARHHPGRDPSAQIRAWAAQLPTSADETTLLFEKLDDAQEDDRRTAVSAMKVEVP